MKILLLFLWFSLFHVSFSQACKPCDGNPIGYSLRNSTHILIGISQPENKIKILQTLKGKINQKVIRGLDTPSPPCHLEVFKPQLNQKYLYFIKSDGEKFNLLGYCGTPALPVDDKNNILLNEGQAKGFMSKELKIPLSGFIKNNM